mgnify:CR=1 FL=1
MIIGLSIFSGILLVLFGISAYYNYKLGVIILSVQDEIEDCLEVLDSRYTSMSLILEKPVFFDSIEVRQVINDISVSRDAILYVANRLTNIDKTEMETS